MNEFIMGDIQNQVMNLCLREKGSWWANHFFRNCEVNEMYEEVMSLPIGGILDRLSKS